MTDQDLERLLGEARQFYNPPPEVLPLEEIWDGVEGVVFGAQLVRGAGRTPAGILSRPRGTAFWLTALAATLVFGVALGRFSASDTWTGANATPSAESVAGSVAGVDPYRVATGVYLDETAALVLSLPVALRGRGESHMLASRADDLLLQTRLLLDSPASTDPGLRALLLDLEVVLAQVVRLRPDRHPNDVNLLERALEQRDVVARLRTAVAHHVAN